MTTFTETEMPGRIARLPRDHVGRPVPWFVATIDGKPDFRVIKPGAIQAALRYKLCWTCGVPFQRQEDRTFLIGPMCAVNRTTAEPPSHYECAAYSATHCPFLVTPRMVRRDRHKPAGAVNPAGTMITRNPGVALVWVTGYRDWSTYKDNKSGLLVDVGQPKRCEWYAEGRAATRAEVLASIDSGLPLLADMAREEGPEAEAALTAMHERALESVPESQPA